MKLDILQPELSELDVPYAGTAVAGFPSPADDFLGEKVDINKLLIKHPESTFYVRVKGCSMENDFNDGDLLVIDRSVEWTANKIALCCVDNEFTLKRIKREGNKCFLIPSNKEFPLIEVSSEQGVMIWGIVTYSIRKL